MLILNGQEDQLAAEDAIDEPATARDAAEDGKVGSRAGRQAAEAIARYGRSRSAPSTSST